MDIYIVFTYRIGAIGPSKYVIGIYDTREKAIERQKEYCGKNWRNHIGTSIIGNNNCTFINKFPYGDCDAIQLFTT